MQKLVYYLFSCDYLKGLLVGLDDYWLSSKIKLFQVLGSHIASNNKKKRLSIIQTANEALSEPQLVSIILPTLNAGKTIKSTIKSIQQQTYPYWELLVIDDGSSDNSIAIIFELSELDSRIKVYKNSENKGAAYSRNIGLYYAKGDFITFHDADDTSHSERLEYQLAKILLNKKYQLIVAQYVRVNTNGEVLVLNGRRKRNYISGMMFRKKVVKKVGYFKRLKISEDSEYYERIVATFGGGARKILCKTLYYALFSPDSLLFSNANVVIKGNKIDYQIHDAELEILRKSRLEHQKIKMGKLSPYQNFIPNDEITTCE